MFRVEVARRPDLPDPAGDAILAEAGELGFRNLTAVRSVHVYLFEGSFDRDAALRVARELLADPVVDVATVDDPLPAPSDDVVELLVAKKSGVMEPVEDSAMLAIRDLGLRIGSVRLVRKYFLFGLAAGDALDLGRRVLANEVIEDVLVGPAPELSLFAKPAAYVFRRVEIALRSASDDELRKLSRDLSLSLSVEEMRAIRGHFEALGRDPTDVEVLTIAQTWSEHCKHKTFTGPIEFEGERIDNLLRTTIMRATTELNRPWCVSVFKDNAGVVRFDDANDVCFKVETHNHPSAIEPYGGAGTGIGGVVRDVLGTGLGAKPILNTDVFCFGPIDMPADRVPRGALHPRHVMRGVVSGVRDYGNRMGIPTANGAVFFDERYVGNPLVFCGTVGLLPRDAAQKEVKPGDAIVVVGGRTGRDGIGGATFSSAELHETSEVVSGGAVQIGNAITERKVQDALLEARARNLYRSITDCGAGGFSSAVGEMGEKVGASVELERVPLKYEGLSPAEIWLSEAQERMVLAVPPENVDAILTLCASEEVEALSIGRFTGDRRLRVLYAGNLVADLDMEFLHHGLPRVSKKARRPLRSEAVQDLPEPREDWGDTVRSILSSPNVSSKEWIIRQYDHEVQGGVVVKPLQGVHNDGPGDACVLLPVLGSTRGIVVANGMNPCYGDLDPYAMAASAIDEALRNVVAVGGSLDQVALLDNFSWGSCDRPEELGALVLAARACYDAAVSYGTPFISGKDSLNNEFNTADGTIIVPPTLLISALGILEDVRLAVTMDLKSAGNRLYVVGETRAELGGSHYARLRGIRTGTVPQVRLAYARRVLQAMARATASATVRSCHDCSEGGLAVAIAEMAFAGDLGADVDLRRVPTSPTGMRDDVVLFSESNSRFVVEVAEARAASFERNLAGIPFAWIGTTTADRRVRAIGASGKSVLDEPIEALRSAWKAPLSFDAHGAGPPSPASGSSTTAGGRGGPR
ncbi:MAG: phosphoribosylformylglycinamidine synthase subunit PurL [Planctomycetes bacterium]|nr:phosphoribosylformylglycinamidine synthase subunit PurL [Planctomycetota bacterium]MBI3844542.1 phosphoribosylformylglycinamidine synthase subunit PurL [Planctomycetota bacterium]